MNIQLPSFRDSFCRMFTACGAVQTQNKSVLAALKKSPLMEIRYREEHQLCHLLVFTGGEKGGNHIHIDMAPSSYFRQRKSPVATHKRNDVNKLLSVIEGMKITVAATSRFECPCDDLPSDSSMLNMLSPEEHDAPDGETLFVKPIGFEITTSDDAFDEIYYSTDKASETLFARLTTTQVVTVGADYITDLFNHHSHFFGVLFGNG